jgi:branched-chain amino acid transport system ATP-binding protein
MMRGAAPAARHGDPVVPVLELVGVEAGYERATVLRDVNVSVPSGTILALLGPNGAGKTTLLRAAMGILKPSAGRILIDGKDVTKAAPNVRARAGLCHIPEGRGVFPSLTVRENLRIHVPSWLKDKSTDAVLDVFPILRERLNQTAGTMSGGQQQMLALARSYLSKPRVVLLDEVSMGLAPKVVDEIFEMIHNLAATGVALVLVEQYVTRALDLAHNVVLLDRGTVAFDGPAHSLDQTAVLRGYLGVGDDAGSSRVPADSDAGPVHH